MTSPNFSCPFCYDLRLPCVTALGWFAPWTGCLSSRCVTNGTRLVTQGSAASRDEKHEKSGLGMDGLTGSHFQVIARWG